MNPGDAEWMERALRLAENSFATPNPGVGCLLLRDGTVVGEGWTQPVGQAHAEVMALRAAGERARGATAYVTLEPCCHWGRTPPCTEALIAAGVARVVAATTDRDPRVGGQGIARLRDAGIDVTVGVLEQEARESNAAFFHFHETGGPLVTLKAAMSLDGKIATRTGNSQWITGVEARQYVHKLRAQTGAIMVGINTLLADDARLTARLPDRPSPRQPLRIVVDSHLRTPLDASAVKLIRSVPETEGVPAPLLIATTRAINTRAINTRAINTRAIDTGAIDTGAIDIEDERVAQLEVAGAEVVRLPADRTGRVDLPALIALLAQRKIISLLVEGGGELSAALLEQGLAHRVLFFLAPKLVGGRSAPTPLEGEGIAQMADAIPLQEMKVRMYGADIAIEAKI